MAFLIRYVLNYKKLPYKTIYSEFPDLEAVTKGAGIPPNGTKLDGVTPYYTCPAITDDATGVALPDSYKIAEYLDKAYPDTPKVIPPGSEALQAAFYDQFHQVVTDLLPIFVPRVPAILSERSVEYYVRARFARFGKPLDQLEPVGEERAKAWEKIKASLGRIDTWLSKSSGPFFMGDTVTFADFVVASLFQGLRIVLGESSEEWKDIERWHNGRWINLLKNLEQFASVEN